MTLFVALVCVWLALNLLTAYWLTLAGRWRRLGWYVRDDSALPWRETLPVESKQEGGQPTPNIQRDTYFWGKCRGGRPQGPSPVSRAGAGE